MYIPNLNLMTDKTEIVDFMQRFSFATIITARDNYPVATHLPFIVTLKRRQYYSDLSFCKSKRAMERYTEQ